MVWLGGTECCGVGVVLKRSSVSCLEGGREGGREGRKSVRTLPAWVWTSLHSVCPRCLSQAWEHGLPSIHPSAALIRNLVHLGGGTQEDQFGKPTR